MPIYEYHCPECDNLFEEWCQRMDDEKSKPCPKCGKTAERIISQTSFALKGDGWYVTEYGSKKGINESRDSSDSTAAKTDNGSGNAGASSGSETASASTGADSSATANSSPKSQPPAATTARSTTSTPSTPAS